MEGMLTGTRIMLSLSLGMPYCGFGGRENRLLCPIAHCSDAGWLVPNRLATDFSSFPAHSGIRGGDRTIWRRPCADVPCETKPAPWNIEMILRSRNMPG